MRIEARHTRRLKLVSLLGIGFAVALAFRLASLQLWAGEAYTAQARSQHEKRTVLQANRGHILDRHGRVLVTNLEAQSFFLNSNISELDNLRAIAVRFSRRDGEDSAEVLKRLRGKRSFVWLARKVMDGLPEDRVPEGVGRMVEMRRSYPMGTLAGQVLGYTDIDNVGIDGIEHHFDALLKGKPGEMVSRVDARGKALGALGAVLRLPEDGGDLVLTIDTDYQSIAEEELEAAVARFQARSGIAIVTQPNTGEILAMANVPLYDPNAFGRYDPKVRRNRAVTDLYEPGSTFKVVAFAGALEEKDYAPEDRIFCENGTMKVAGGVIRDTHPHGWLTVREVIEASSNIGTIKIARTLGKAEFFRYIRLFGFGSLTGGNLPGEVPGDVKHPSKWSERSLETIAIGQELGVTALQMVTAYGAVANGGRLLAPRIFLKTLRGDSVVSVQRPQVVRQVISPQTAATVTGVLGGAVTRGTGSNARVSGYQVAGKTGTAQKALEGGRGYAPNDYNASFIGYLPAERPELLCLVIVDSPKGIRWGSKVAAPVFSRIMQRILSLRKTRLRHRAVVDGKEGDGRSEKQVPVLKGLSRESALRVLDRRGFQARVLGSDTRVLDQAVQQKEVLLYVAPDSSGQVEGEVRTPDVVGVPLRQAVYRLTAAGLRVETSGSGRVVGQTPRAGTAVERGTVCRIEGRSVASNEL